MYQQKIIPRSKHIMGPYNDKSWYMDCVHNFCLEAPLKSLYSKHSLLRTNVVYQEIPGPKTLWSTNLHPHN